MKQMGEATKQKMKQKRPLTPSAKGAFNGGDFGMLLLECCQVSLGMGL